MAIVGLYRDIYGIRPKANRLLLDPHLTTELNGTLLHYDLRGQRYDLSLSKTGSLISVAHCSVQSPTPYAVNATDSAIEYFPGRGAEAALSVTRPTAGRPLTVVIDAWTTELDGPRRWLENSVAEKTAVTRTIGGLRPGRTYQLRINGRVTGSQTADSHGRAQFTARTRAGGRLRFEVLVVSL